ncbi:MAG: hypothetical protein QFX38_00600 [Methanothermobacter sp.]|nr:hypothetical protein [Methanothermobacter sp.]
MKKENWIGIIGGMGFFLIILFILNFNSDFDQKLINDVESGVPTDELIARIEDETEKERLEAERRLESHLWDMKYWGQSSLPPEEELKYEIEIYNGQMRSISECDRIRKQFVKGEISKEEFLAKIKDLEIYEI